MLAHYTRDPFIFNPEQKYEQEGLMKPNGLWLSAEGAHSWKEYCTGESWGLKYLAHCAEIVLRPAAEILRITSVAELDDFSAHYSNGDIHDCRAVDWSRVAQFYDGILIAPYQWERRTSFMWYYTWDCASGCVWNLNAIESVSALREAA